MARKLSGASLFKDLSPSFQHFAICFNIWGQRHYYCDLSLDPYHTTHFCAQYYDKNIDIAIYLDQKKPVAQKLSFYRNILRKNMSL